MIEQTGSTKGIENYSRHFDGRSAGTLGVSAESPLGKGGPRGIDIIPAPAERFNDAGDRLLDGLVQHQFQINNKLVGHLIPVLKAEHIRLRVFRSHGPDIDPLGLASLAKLGMEILVGIFCPPYLYFIGPVIIKGLADAASFTRLYISRQYGQLHEQHPNPHRGGYIG